MNLQKLEIEFTGIGEVKGFHFKQVYSSKFAYIYQVTDTNINYEVFERKNSPKSIDFEKRIYSETDFKETYPKANSFGVWAWTYKNLNDAIEKAADIEDKIMDKIINSNK